MEESADRPGRHQWGSGFGGEFTGASFYGDIALIDVGGNVVRSVNDGSTWTPVLNILSSPRNDTNIAYDAAGTLYATNMSGTCTTGDCALKITRATGLTTWTTPEVITPISGYVGDRPWMAADPSRPNFLYATWSGETSEQPGGWFSYCNGNTTCDHNAAWCRPSALPSGNKCHGIGGPTCMVASGAEDVWLAIGNDTGCDPIPEPYRASVGIRKISNLQELGLSCTPPDLTTWGVQCLYYNHDTTLYHPENPVPPGGPGTSPGNYRRWSDRLQVSRDGHIAVTLQGFTDVATGGVCDDSTSSQCRMDVFTAIYSEADGWCLPTGCGNTAPVNQADMYRANLDSSSAWVDHATPATMIFNYRIVANSWYDFRNDPANDAQYQIVESFVELAEGTGTWYRYEEAPPSSPGLWWPNVTFYGDVDTTALSPLHAFIARQLSDPDTGDPNAVGYLWSPDAYLSF